MSFNKKRKVKRNNLDYCNLNYLAPFKPGVQSTFLGSRRKTQTRVFYDRFNLLNHRPFKLNLQT